MKRRCDDVFHPDEEKKVEKTNTKTREEKSLGTFAATSFIISPRSFSVASARLCSSLFLSLSLSLCLFFFRASKNLSFFLWFFGFFFGCFFNGWVFARTEKEKKFWIGHLHTTSQILLSPPFVYLFTEHTALLCTPHHQRQDARLLLKSLL